jgi:ubiquinone/menaquinone biosynthesis C-methylase UbiE
MTDTDFWDKAAHKYAKSAISDMAAYTQTMDRIKAILQPHHRVLELGCGTGSTALELASGVERYIGTDNSPGMIQIAQGKLPPNLPHLSFAVHTAGDLPTGTNDVILALNLLHLVDNLEEVLANVYAGLPSGGLFIAKTGLMKDGAWILSLVIPVMQMIGKAPFVGNLHETDLTKLLNNAGFEVTETLIQKGIVPRMFTIARKP